MTEMHQTSLRRLLMNADQPHQKHLLLNRRDFPNTRRIEQHITTQRTEGPSYHTRQSVKNVLNHLEKKMTQNLPQFAKFTPVQNSQRLANNKVYFSFNFVSPQNTWVEAENGCRQVGISISTSFIINIVGRLAVIKDQPQQDACNTSLTSFPNEQGKFWIGISEVISDTGGTLSGTWSDSTSHTVVFKLNSRSDFNKWRSQRQRGYGFMDKKDGKWETEDSRSNTTHDGFICEFVVSLVPNGTSSENIVS